MAFESPLAVKLWSRKLADELAQDSVFARLMHHNIKPTIRWQRLKYIFKRPFIRLRDAWLVLVGRAEIYDGQDD